MPSGRRPVDERSTRQRVKVEVFVSVEGRVHALDVATDEGGHELMPYRKASIHRVTGFTPDALTRVVLATAVNGEKTRAYFQVLRTDETRQETHCHYH